MQLAPGKLALCFRLFYIFEREPEPPSKKKKNATACPRNPLPFPKPKATKKGPSQWGFI